MAQALIPASLKIQPPPPELAREPLVANQRPIGWISDAVAGVAEGKTPRWWWCAFIPSVTMLSMLGVMILYLMSSGVGVWGQIPMPPNAQVPDADIKNLVAWILALKK